MENELAGVDDKGAPLSKVPRFMDYVDSDSDREEVEPTHELDKYLALRVPKARGIKLWYKYFKVILITDKNKHLVNW